MAGSMAILMALLGLGFFGTRIAAALRIPHSVLLVVIGVGAGSLLRLQGGAGVAPLVDQYPEIILYVLLPPLVFESSYNFDFHEFRRDLVPITALAVVSLVVSTILVGLGLSYLLGLPLVPSLVFGALISATDPVAVVALFKEIGAPKRLTGLVEGESLLNDGTAIVMFRVMLGFAAVPVFNAGAVAAGVAQFLEVALGGVLVGLAVAWVVAFFLRLTSASAAAQLGLTVVAAYLSFIVADHGLHVSGVISTMTVGLYLGTRARLELGKEALQGMGHVWEFMALTANVVVFFGVGLTIDTGVIRQSLPYLPLALLIVYVVRALSVYGVVPLVNLSRVAKPISGAYQAILTWGGLRGGLAMALVLTLPADFPHKQLFLALAAAIVLSTLLVNALTIKPFMALLKLDRLNPVDEAFYLKTLDLLGQRVFDPLVHAGERGIISAALVAEKREAFAAQVAASARAAGREAPTDEGTDRAFAFYSLLLREKRYYDRGLEDGVLTRQAYLRLARSVSDRKDLLEEEGEEALQRHDFGFFGKKGLRKRIKVLLAKVFGPSLTNLSLGLEIPLHRLLAIREAGEESDLPAARELADRWGEVVKEQIEEYYSLYPTYATGLQSAFIADTVRAASLATIEELGESDIISGAVAARARLKVESTHEEASREARLLLAPSVAYLLGRTPLFSGLPEEVLADVARGAKRLVVAQGTVLVREGEPGSSFYLVTAGIVEVRSALDAARGVSHSLYIGDYFGEMSLVLKGPRSATVTAARHSQLVEIDQETFQGLLRRFPDLGREVTRMAELRLEAQRGRAADPS